MTWCVKPCTRTSRQETVRALHRLCARYIVGDGRPALAAATHFRACAVRDDEEAVLALEQAARECMVSMPDQAAELAQQAFALTTETHPLWLLAGERTVETLVNVQRDGDGTGRGGSAARCCG